MGMVEKLFVKTSEIWKEDDILYCSFNQSVIDLKLLQELYEVRCMLCAGRPHLDFHDMRKIKYVTKEAREFFANPEHRHLVKAGAVLINSKVQAIIGNYYLKIQKPLIPTRFFYTTNGAMAWLDRYR